MSAKDWADKDFYKILGVPKDAKPEAIKKAFRKIARENHPDQHPGDKKAELRFKEASEAHDILSDPDKRKEYDEMRSLLGGGGYRFQQRPGTAGGAGAEDIFARFAQGAAGGLGDIFGNLFGTPPSSTQQRTRVNTRNPRRGTDVEGKVSISFLESIDGATVAVAMTSEEPCPTCKGTGAKAGSVPHVCAHCSGSGVEPGNAGPLSTTPCRECKGRGLIVDDPCPACGGTGKAKSNKTMQVRIPAGVDNDQRIRIKGKGGKGENGGASGDLYVTVKVTPHPIFGRSGYNLTVDVPVRFDEATLGSEVDVPTLKGTPVRLRIPPNTPNGRTFRVRGKGVQKANGEYGDLLATMSVVVPTKLSDDAKAKLGEFANLVDQPNPRESLLQGQE
ncbi:MAG: molecular chaperone DnaJ [Propionibacteriaceae bacterium]|nr:molecular chaperone DnaJ [Propionibacteriaceae bacterium]